MRELGPDGGEWGISRCFRHYEVAFLSIEPFSMVRKFWGNNNVHVNLSLSLKFVLDNICYIVLW